ncbi:homeobox protein 2-like [Mizuhopecten yessoensis]|uniref:homeobox protein 2-like n=1 Tax=Mizuhopecten yessoensis TaxID=6573 RepID=UPI000B45A0BC|nr:homeobox protein 2-like [Mizuhopecten yessoensis]
MNNIYLIAAVFLLVVALGQSLPQWQLKNGTGYIYPEYVNYTSNHNHNQHGNYSFPNHNGTHGNHNYPHHNGTHGNHSFSNHNGTHGNHSYPHHNGTHGNHSFPYHNGTYGNHSYPNANGSRIVYDGSTFLYDRWTHTMALHLGNSCYIMILTPYQQSMLNTNNGLTSLELQLMKKLSTGHKYAIDFPTLLSLGDKFAPLCHGTNYLLRAS